jgi:hypothetical protein
MQVFARRAAARGGRQATRSLQIALLVQESVKAPMISILMVTVKTPGTKLVKVFPVTTKRQIQPFKFRCKIHRRANRRRFNIISHTYVEAG